MRTGSNREHPRARCARLGWLLLLTALGTPEPAQTATLKGQVSCRSVSPETYAVVYVARIPGVRFEPPEEPAIMDQKYLVFTPHVLPVLVGTTVAFPNSDRIRHNVFSYSEPKMFNLGTYPPDTIRHVIFDQPGLVSLLCNVHPEMSAFILVLETPYFTTTDEEGHYTLEDLPGGKLPVRAWAETCSVREATVLLETDETLNLDFRLDLRKNHRGSNAAFAFHPGGVLTHLPVRDPSGPGG